MRKRVLTAIAGCLYYSGLVALVRWFVQHSEKRLVVLNYHRATGGDLRRHLLYLRRYYRILHLEEALEELFTSNKEGKRTGDRRTALVVTFDDGYRDNYTDGFVLARELKIPITIFLIPGYITSGDYFWWLEGKRLVCRAQVREVTIEGRAYHLDQAQERKTLAKVIDGRLRSATSVSEREAFLLSVRKALRVSSSLAPEEIPSLPLTWEQAREMEESGWVSFAAHTMCHPILAYLINPVEVQHEIRESRTQLQQHLGHSVRAFAYPVGQLQHIGNSVIHAVQEAGYDWALTSLYGCNTLKSNPYLLRRVEVDVSQHWLVMAASAAGLWELFTRLRWLLITKHK